MSAQNTFYTMENNCYKRYHHRNYRRGTEFQPTWPTLGGCISICRWRPEKNLFGKKYKSPFHRRTGCNQADKLNKGMSRSAFGVREGNQPWQLPSVVWKKPLEHAEHAVPFVPVVQPVLHVHCPSEPQTPLRQLQVDGRLATAGVRQTPVPVIPWSHLLQLGGQG